MNVQSQHQATATPVTMPSFIVARNGLLQRKCACGQHTTDQHGECTECRKKRLGLQRRAVNARGSETAPPIVHEVLRSPGRPLDSATLAFMEPRFGHDFSQVRVHTDAKAAESARAVNALAYTVGRDMVFGAGQYAPGTSVGKQLLAHELTHVTQQRQTAGLARYTLEVALTRDAYEQEAERVAEQVVNSDTAISDDVTPAQPQMQRLGDISQRPSTLPCPLPPGSPPSVIENILFASGISTLTVAQKATIEAFVVSWRALGASADVRVDGFASTSGGDLRNWQLSCKRAEAVEAELRSPSSGAVAGIPSSHITFFAHGETAEFSISDQGPNQRATISSTARVPPPLPPPPSPPSCATPTNPDRSGRAFNPTTNGETRVCVTNPIDCNDAFDCRNIAFAAARTSTLAGAHLGPQDAFRHCVWSCCMAQEMGTAAEAERFGTAHENSNPSPIPFDNQMDLHNNAIGRSLGTPSADCEAECRSAVTSGRLRTIRGPHTRPRSPVTTTCIGASDQPWP